MNQPLVSNCHEMLWISQPLTIHWTGRKWIPSRATRIKLRRRKPSQQLKCRSRRIPRGAHRMTLATCQLPAIGQPRLQRQHHNHLIRRYTTSWISQLLQIRWTGRNGIPSRAMTVILRRRRTPLYMLHLTWTSYRRIFLRGLTWRILHRHGREEPRLRVTQNGIISTLLLLWLII